MFDSLSKRVIGTCIRVHRSLGPGLLEHAYEACLEHALKLDGFSVERQVPVALEFEGLHVPHAFQADLIVEHSLIVEVKSVAALLPVHRAQLRTYLTLAEIDLGLLVNFNVPMLRDGLRRVRS